ncbi:glycoside hydrolase family 16 [Micractinium conductrix]|uniref:Glycoside hydrolase family 16 n=1 Tax=Micractinium conductrix TaxID=554055 RepID=A0A2P6V6N9_9CHLO|nr:glycoside hydrolase family 16 [Micractinium conductrix]|eukprot:PSC69753.1 glycoside hydrolase family 16 [Micractinium conductrix]
MRPASRATRALLLCALAALGSNGCTAARRLAEEPPARGSCAAQVAGLPGAEDGKWVDAATPAAACTIQRCTHLNHSMCVGESPPQTTLQLVYSDEFDAEGRAFGVGASDPRWTAENMFYLGTAD